MNRPTEEMEKAISEGDLQTLETLLPGVDKKYYALTEYACKYGKLEILQYLHRNKYVLCQGCETEIVKNGHIDCARFMLSLLECDIIAIANSACLYGNLEILKLYHQNGGIIGQNQIKYVMKSQTRACREYCIENHVRDRTFCEYVARLGNLRLMTEALENGYDMGDSFNEAVKNGHLNIVKFLCEHGYKPDRRSFLFARRSWNYEMLDYLKSIEQNI